MMSCIVWKNQLSKKFEPNRCRALHRNPWSWLKLEASILKFFAEKGRRYLSLKELIFTVRKSKYGMSMDDLKSFLQFHLRYRNFIFDESVLDSLDNVYDTNASHMITDPWLINKTFAVITSPLGSKRSPGIESSSSAKNRFRCQATFNCIGRYWASVQTEELKCRLFWRSCKIVRQLEPPHSIQIIGRKTPWKEVHSTCCYVALCLVTRFTISSDNQSIWCL